MDDAALKRAVADLGAKDFAVRRQATTTLQTAGDAARPYLEQAAKSDDPEVSLTAKRLLRSMERSRSRPQPDRDYLTRLYAIRALEQMGSQNALPVLQRVAEGDDLTLADAAREAMTVITGKALPAAEQETEAWLKRLAVRLPADAGFVGLLRLDRNRREAALVTLAQEMMKQPALQGVMGNFGGEANLSPMLEQFETKLVQVVGMTGNIRLDAVATIASDEIGDRDRGYMAWVVKGRWDPARVRKSFAQGMREETTIAGQRVLSEGRRGPACCILDGETAVFSIGDGAEAVAAHIAEALTAERGEHETPAHLAPAFKLVLQDKRQLAAAGALSEAQKATIRRELEPELQRAEAREAGADAAGARLMLAGLRFGLNLAKVAQFTAYLGESGALTLTAEADEATVTAMHATLGQFQEGLDAQMAQAPPEARQMLDTVLPQGAKGLWSAQAAGQQITAQTNLAELAKAAMLFAGVERRRARPADPARREAEARRRAEAARREAEARRRAAEAAQ